jgi:hypothetical protein
VELRAGEALNRRQHGTSRTPNRIELKDAASACSRVVYAEVAPTHTTKEKSMTPKQKAFEFIANPHPDKEYPDGAYHSEIGRFMEDLPRDGVGTGFATTNVTDELLAEGRIVKVNRPSDRSTKFSFFMPVAPDLGGNR